MKIGLSLSFCVKDISTGKVQFDDVEMLITGTSIGSYQEFLMACDSYATTYWDQNPNLCRLIAQKLWDAGKIHQPKLDHSTECEMYCETPPWHRALLGQGVHWLTVEPRR